MDAVLLMSPSPSSSSSATHFSLRPVFQPLHRKEENLQQKSITACCCLFSNGFSSLQQQRQWEMLNYVYGRDGRRRRIGGSVVVSSGAKKKKSSGKSDTHSFAPKSDEATGPFPEAVLLKKRTVQEDGRVLPEFADGEEEKLFDFLSLQLESDLNVERVRHYEVVYLIHEDHVDEVDGIVSKVQDFIRENKGKIWRLNNWGLRRLAYKIKKAKNANYILMNFELEAKCINHFKGMLDKDERIIRHLVIKRDEAITEDCPPPQEFHTLRASGMDGDDDAEGRDWDGESELEMSGNDDDDDDDFGDNIIVVDEEEDDGSYEGTRTLRANGKVEAVL